MAKVTVCNGGLTKDIIVGDSATVLDVREGIAGELGIDEAAKAFLTRGGSVNAVAGEDTTVVQEGDRVEFVKPSGSKGL